MALQNDFPQDLGLLIALDDLLVDAESVPAQAEQPVDRGAVEKALGDAVHQVEVVGARFEVAPRAMMEVAGRVEPAQRRRRPNCWRMRSTSAIVPGQSK